MQCLAEPRPFRIAYRSRSYTGHLGLGRLVMLCYSESTTSSADIQVGPEFISMVSGEVRQPRRILAKAFRSTIWRILIFYLGSALCVGINAPYNDPALLGAIAAGAPGAAKSPYIINMNRLGIPILPHIVNACMITSVFSIASSFTFAASRSLYRLGLEGQAPKIVTRTNRFGLPYVSVAAVLAFGCLSYLSVSNSTAKGAQSHTLLAESMTDG